MKSALILFDNIVSLYIWVLIINVVISWLVTFNVLNTGNRFVYTVLDVSYKLTAPPLNFIRKFLPNLGSIDISPIKILHKNKLLNWLQTFQLPYIWGTYIQMFQRLHELMKLVVHLEDYFHSLLT